MKSNKFYYLQKNAAPYLFVAPFFILFLLFNLYPLFKSFLLSFYITNGPKSEVFVGLENFKYLLQDKDFHKALWNTCVFAFFSIFLQLPLALALAIFLNNQKLKFKNFFRLTFFLTQFSGAGFCWGFVYGYFSARVWAS